MKRFSVAFVLAFALLFSPISVQSAAITVASFGPSTLAVYLPGVNYAKETILAGQPVYVDSSVVNALPTTPNIGLAKSNGAGDAVKAVGLAGNGASVGQPVKVIIRDPLLKLGTGLTVGTVVFLSTNASGLTDALADAKPTTGQYTVIFGIINSATTMNLGATTLGSNYIGVMRSDQPNG